MFSSECSVVSSEPSSDEKDFYEKESNNHAHALPEVSNSAKLSPKKETGAPYLLSLLNRPPSKFIYPEPIYIQIKPKGNPQINVKKEPAVKSTMRTNNAKTVSPAEDFTYARKNSMEIRKSLKFEEESTVTNSSSGDIEAADTMCADRQQNILPLDANEFSSMLHPFSEVTVKTDLKVIGFTSAKGTKLSVSKEVLAQGKGIFGQEDFSDITKEMPTPVNTSTSMGFSMASGKNVTISKQAMVRAQVMFEEIDSNPSSNPEDTKTSSSSNEKLPISKMPAPCKKIEIPQPVNFETLKTSSIGFSTPSGKNLGISRKAMVRAQAMFDQVNEDITLSSNLGETPTTSTNHKLSVAKTPLQFAIKTETPPSVNCHTPFTGFSMASGKNVQISKQSMVRAQAIFEQVNTDELSSNSQALKEVDSSSRNPPTTAVKVTTPLPLGHETPTGASLGFSTAAGKNVTISKAAMARAQVMFDEVGSENAENTPKAASTLNRLKLENETPKMSNPVKKVLMPDSTLSGGRKLFQNTEKMEVDVPNVANKERFENVSDLPIFPLAHPLLSTPPRLRAKDDDANQFKGINQDVGESGDEWVSSPTIGKKKIKNKVLPDPETPSSYYESPTTVSATVLGLRSKARQAQKSAIALKRNKSFKVSPQPGILYVQKKNSIAKKTLKEAAGISTLPEDYPPYKLVNDYGIFTSVYLVRSTNASSFSFFAWEHFPEENFSKNSSGFQIGKFNVNFFKWRTCKLLMDDF